MTNYQLLITPSEWRWVCVVSFIILTITIAPNIFGYLVAPPTHHYMGLTFYNWQDANSYLAKLTQGMRGEWLYTIPFTAEPGEGVFLYPNYLLLGHIARWLGVEHVVIFHAARLFSGALLLASLYAFMARFFPTVSDRRFAFLLAAIGSGFGGLAMLFGLFTSDILNAEIFPFLTILTNPHFPLALAAQLWVLEALVSSRTLTQPPPGGVSAPPPLRRAVRRGGGLGWGLVGGTRILALMQPYGVIVCGAVGGLWLMAQWAQNMRVGRMKLWQAAPRDTLMRLLLMALLAAPFALNTAYALATNAALAAWNQQNITLSPPPWQWLIALGLMLPFAAVGLGVTLRRLWRAWRDEGKLNANDFLPLCWFGVIAVLVYLPNAQQRRFAFGLFIPCVILAVYGLSVLRNLNRPSWRLLWVAVSSLTNVILMLIAFLTLLTPSPVVFFTQSEWRGIQYLRTQAPRALVLASPDMGLYIPAWSGQRVIYGHPHETGNARARATAVQQFYEGKLSEADAFLAPVDFIFVGPRERDLSAKAGRTFVSPPSFSPVFSDGDVTIYARQK